jgi:hypothetical protein
LSVKTGMLSPPGFITPGGAGQATVVPARAASRSPACLGSSREGSPKIRSVPAERHQ